MLPSFVFYHFIFIFCSFFYFFIQIYKKTNALLILRVYAVSVDFGP